MAKAPTVRRITAKQQILEQLIDVVFSKVSTYLSTQFLEIGECNRDLIGNGVLPFGYKGETFLFVRSGRGYVRPNQLDKTLTARMDRMLKLREQIQLETDYIKAFFISVLNKSCAIEKVIQLLPETMHEAVYQLYPQVRSLQIEADVLGIQELTLQHKKGMDYLKQRLLHNLVM